MIIAEVGQNFCGDMNLAKRLIVLAKENGADLVKFQLYDHKQLYANHPEVPNVELRYDQAKLLFDYGTEIGIEVFFSVFDVERVKWCEEIGVKRYKVATGFIHPASGQNMDLAEALLQTGKEVVISYSRYPDYVNRKPANWKMLYCVPKYPANLNDLDADFGDFFGANDNSYDFDGFSDHTIGLDAAKIALARGAQIIEKHFCLRHDLGIDAAWSMTPEELAELVRWEKICKEVL